eukprot:scaffold10799_cov17-Tisochrysis_lutea.AAC.1
MRERSGWAEEAERLGGGAAAGGVGALEGAVGSSEVEDGGVERGVVLWHASWASAASAAAAAWLAAACALSKFCVVLMPDGFQAHAQAGSGLGGGLVVWSGVGEAGPMPRGGPDQKAGLGQETPMGLANV